MSAGAIPCAFTAAITFAISALFARSAPDGVFASAETPSEIWARSGTVRTEPCPVTTTVCEATAAEEPTAPPAPARSTTTRIPRDASLRMCLLYGADRTPCHTDYAAASEGSRYGRQL